MFKIFQFLQKLIFWEKIEFFTRGPFLRGGGGGCGSKICNFWKMFKIFQFLQKSTSWIFFLLQNFLDFCQWKGRCLSTLVFSWQNSAFFKIDFWKFFQESFSPSPHPGRCSSLFRNKHKWKFDLPKKTKGTSC